MVWLLSCPAPRVTPKCPEWPSSQTPSITQNHWQHQPQHLGGSKLRLRVGFAPGMQPTAPESVLQSAGLGVGGNLACLYSSLSRLNIYTIYTMWCRLLCQLGDSFYAQTFLLGQEKSH